MQGNGVARDKISNNDDDLYIFDMYNVNIWPGDSWAKGGISHEQGFRSGCGDEEYLTKLNDGLQHCFEHFKPDILLFNAGTDVLMGDPLGCCKV